jgi:hypothetical protein
MVNAIIFSFNRASQLNLLIESIQKNASGVFKLNILYKANTPDFSLGYEILKEKTSHLSINWIEEKSFRDDLIGLFDKHMLFTTFFTDDDILYNKITEEEIIKPLKYDDDIFCFSLRLGKNTKYCYSERTENILIDPIEHGYYFTWDWIPHYADLNYPLSVDGHLFRSNDILKMTKNISFTNPNTYEAGLQFFSKNSPWFKMAAYQISALVNSPSNMVQNVFTTNRQGEKFGISAEELNQKFINGEIIDFSSIDFSRIVGAHQELLFSFKKL